MPMDIVLPGQGETWRMETPAGPVRLSGLREPQPEQQLLLRYLSTCRGRVLIPCPGHSPLLPAVVAAQSAEAQVEVLEMDLHDAHLLRNKLASFPGVRVLCATDPEQASDQRQTALLAVGATMDRLLAFDLIERLDMILPPGSPAWVATPLKRAEDLGRKLKHHLKKAQTLHRDGTGVVWKGLLGGNVSAWTPRRCEFEATTVDARVRLCTRPGVFSHGRPDAGGLALAETVETMPGMRLLELGCGCGLAGLLLAERLRRTGSSPAEVVLVDSHVRAVDCARRGVAANGMDFVSVVHTDVYESAPATFDVVIGNPPYYADLRIGRYFMEVALRALKPGGRLWLVSKHGETMAELAATLGFQTEPFRRRGYDITLCRKS